MAVVAQNNWIPLCAIAIDASATTTGLVTFPNMDLLMIQYSITGYDVADTAGFNFNQNADLFGFGGGCTQRYMYAAAGTTVLTNVIELGSTAGGAITVRVSGLTTTQAQTGVLYVNGSAISIYNATASASGVSPPIEMPGSAIAINGPFNSLELITRGGNNMLAGSGFAVFGANIG